MEVLRHVIVLVHLVGFAMILGPWIAELVARRRRFTRLMEYGLVVMLVSGVILALPWPEGFSANYVKIWVKLAILIVLGAVLGIGGARQRRTGEPVAAPLFYSAGLLTLAAAAIAVIWR